MDIKSIKSQFPIFKNKINGKSLIYLDNANSSQKPKCVIDRISKFYSKEFSNIGRSVHSLAVTATNRFEETRDLMKKYINAKSREELIFTKNATEAINCVASTYGDKFINKGDELPEPTEWFHDIYRIDGSPYDKKEIEFIIKILKE